MKAAIYDHPGPPDVLRYAAVPDSVCPSDGVVIRVEAAAIDMIVDLDGGQHKEWIAGAMSLCRLTQEANPPVLRDACHEIVIYMTILIRVRKSYDFSRPEYSVIFIDIAQNNQFHHITRLCQVVSQMTELLTRNDIGFPFMSRRSLENPMFSA